MSARDDVIRYQAQLEEEARQKRVYDERRYNTRMPEDTFDKWVQRQSDDDLRNYVQENDGFLYMQSHCKFIREVLAKRQAVLSQRDA